MCARFVQQLVEAEETRREETVHPLSAAAATGVHMSRTETKITGLVSGNITTKVEEGVGSQNTTGN